MIDPNYSCASMVRTWPTIASITRTDPIEAGRGDMLHYGRARASPLFIFIDGDAKTMQNGYTLCYRRIIFSNQLILYLTYLGMGWWCQRKHATVTYLLTSARPRRPVSCRLFNVFYVFVFVSYVCLWHATTAAQADMENRSNTASSSIWIYAKGICAKMWRPPLLCCACLPPYWGYKYSWSTS